MMSQVTANQLENKILLDLYRTMQLVRRCELQLAKASQQGLIHGACHTYVGQEAIAAGVCANLRKDDAVFSTHRGHGHALAMGVLPEQLFAELYGRETGCSAGRGGSMHLFAPEVGLMGTSGIVGPCMLQAAGAGYSFKLLKADRVAVAFFGDGAVNNGAFHEAMEASELDDIDCDIAEAVNVAHQVAKLAENPEPESSTKHIYAPTLTFEPVCRDDTEETATTRETTYAGATFEALADAMQNDPTIFVLGEGVGERGGNFNTTPGMYEKYGAVRLCDTPICERGFVGLSAGAAMTGTRPVVDFMFADFILDAVGEIVNQIAKIQYMSGGRLQMPVVLRGCIGIGHSAATHHSGSYYSMFSHFPGLRVVVPSTPYDAKGLFAHALRSNDPVLFLEHRELLNVKGPVPESPYELPFGKAAIVQGGTDVTVVALAEMVHKSLDAIQELEEQGISVELIDPRTVSPLDCDTILQSVVKTGRLLIADESFEPFGLGAEISAQVGQRGFDHLDAPIHRLSGAHTPTPYSPAIEKTIVPQVDDIVHAGLDLLEE